MDATVFPKRIHTGVGALVPDDLIVAFNVLDAVFGHGHGGFQVESGYVTPVRLVHSSFDDADKSIEVAKDKTVTGQSGVVEDAMDGVHDGPQPFFC